MVRGPEGTAGLKHLDLVHNINSASAKPSNLLFGITIACAQATMNRRAIGSRLPARADRRGWDSRLKEARRATAVANGNLVNPVGATLEVIQRAFEKAGFEFIRRKRCRPWRVVAKGANRRRLGPFSSKTTNAGTSARAHIPYLSMANPRRLQEHTSFKPTAVKSGFCKTKPF